MRVAVATHCGTFASSCCPPYPGNGIKSSQAPVVCCGCFSPLLADFVAKVVDGVTFADIDLSGREAWLAGLREELVSRTYRPDPVRRVSIQKPGGGERPLGIPTIRDRVGQTAAKL